MAYALEVVGSNPGTVYWMDLSDAASHYIKENLKIKVAKWSTPNVFFKGLYHRFY